MQTEIETRIRTRQYQSPARARSAVGRSHLSARDKRRLGELIDGWENEPSVDIVVGGLPAEKLEAELVDVATGELAMGFRGKPSRVPETRALASQPFALRLDALVRVRLTTAGIAALHAARQRICVPEDIVARGGVWQGPLWELMTALGPAYSETEPLTMASVLEVLEARTE